MAVPKLNILQWNARSIKANQNALSHYVQTHPIFTVLAITETHLRPAEPFKFLNYTSFRSDRPLQKGGGAALFIHPLLPAEEIHFHSPLEAVAVRIRYKGKKNNDSKCLHTTRGKQEPGHRKSASTSPSTGHSLR